MIRDLEVLLLSVRDQGLRAYLREAVTCYNAGAYRAAVVLATAAAMDGLRQKLTELASSGGASSDLRDAEEHVASLFKEQCPFEFELIQAMKTKANMLTPSEADKLELILKTRHMCAHPSGHKGSAEEARDAISASVDLVLARPAALGMIGVTELVCRLAGINFFPNADDRNRVIDLVKHELARLNPSLMKALAFHVIKALKDSIMSVPAPSLFSPPPPPLIENCKLFLIGMVANLGDARSAVWSYVSPLLEEPKAFAAVCSVLAEDPDGFAMADPPTRARALGAARNCIRSASGLSAIKGWLQHEVLEPHERDDALAAVSAAYVQTEKLDKQCIDVLGDLGLNDFLMQALRLLVEQANSNTFDTANRAIRCVQALQPEHASLFTSEMKLEYIMNLARVAEWGSHAAKDIVNGGLGARADFVDSLVSEIQRDPKGVVGRSRSWLLIAKICASSGRTDAFPPILSLCGPPNVTLSEGSLDVLDYLKRQPDEHVAVAAAELASKIRSLSSSVCLQ